VFAGSRAGVDPEFAVVARDLGAQLAQRHVGLVYGGGSVGLMGLMADAVLAGGGEVIGVIPEGLFHSEVGHAGVTELRQVGSMHERKALMADLSDGFIALPGGLGTLEELFEQLTWAQIGIHHKPVVALDVSGFFEPLFTLIDHAQAAGFVPRASSRLLTRARSVDEALDGLGLPAVAAKASDSR
jgi:uncharacterized protein (TIGR00730 family)